MENGSEIIEKHKQISFVLFFTKKAGITYKYAWIIDYAIRKAL